MSLIRHLVLVTVLAIVLLTAVADSHSLSDCYSLVHPCFDEDPLQIYASEDKVIICGHYFRRRACFNKLPKKCNSYSIVKMLIGEIKQHLDSNKCI